MQVREFPFRRFRRRAIRKAQRGSVPSCVRGKKKRLNIIVSGGKWRPFEGVVRLLLRGCC